MSVRKVWASSDDGKIEYVSLTPDRLDELIDVLQNSFYPFENVCKALGLANKPEAYADVDEMLRDTAKNGMTILAIDKETGKVVGGVFNKVQHKNTSTKDILEEYMKKAKYQESKDMFEFLITMEDSIDPFTPCNADCLLDIMFLVVSPQYARLGIATKLCEISVNLATELYKGNNVKVPLDGNALPLGPRPQIVTAIFSTYKSQKIGRKLNFDILKEISYEDVYVNGKSYASIIGNDTKGFTLECKKLE